MPYQPPVSLRELALYPRMTRWFGLTLLVKLGWRVAIAELFGRFADGRLMVAALDKSTEADHAAAAVAHLPGGVDEAFTPDEDGALWIDYVADLGDGFDSTFAVASLLAREKLVIGPLIALLLVFGFFPQPMINVVEQTAVTTMNVVGMTDPLPGSMGGK